jgi:hypothetical protein
LYVFKIFNYVLEFFKRVQSSAGYYKNPSNPSNSLKGGLHAPKRPLFLQAGYQKMGKPYILCSGDGLGFSNRVLGLLPLKIKRCQQIENKVLQSTYSVQKFTSRLAKNQGIRGK